MLTALSVQAFAADRSQRLTEADDELEPVVRAWLAAGGRDPGDLLTAAGVLFVESYEAVGGDTDSALASARAWAAQMRPTLAATEVKDPVDDAQVQRITYWLATAAVNGGVAAAAALGATDPGRLVWLTMHDQDVREMHVAVDGQQREVGDTFDVGGHQLAYPGQPVGPPEVWINCRCLLAPAPDEFGAIMTRTLAKTPTPRDVYAEQDPDDVDTPPQVAEPTGEVPWYGVLAPEGVPTGDRRMFANGALRNRDFPLPLRFVKSDVGAHDGAVVVGNITRIWREGNLVYGAGTMRPGDADANEAVDLIAGGYMRGVSVDLDDVTVEYAMDDNSPERELEVVTDGRISAATLVAIPAFAEAYLALGYHEGDPEAPDDEVMPGDAATDDAEPVPAFATVSDTPWSDFTQADYTDEQWFAATVLHTAGDSRSKDDNKLPIREPSGTLNRNGVHAAAARFNQTDGPAEAKASAASALRGAYSTLGEEPPEVIANAAGQTETFAPGTKDGPGWLTNPRDSQRLRNYWTRGAGAAKIAWGTPGDFNRCRVNLAEYIANPQWLAGTCANLHKEALGVWPGQEGASADTLVASGDPASAYTMDTGRRKFAPAAWFEDPALPGPSPLTIMESGRVLGHLATWDVCHTGFGQKVCRTAPHSASGYRYFQLGSYLTESGVVPVGTITLGTGHAELKASGAAAMAHYDNTGAAVAYVAAGEDEHGIWVAGTLAPDVTEDDIVKLRAAKLSGDWRPFGTDLELVAALAVNVPGFPVPHTAFAADGTRQTSLVAAGIVEREADQERGLSADDIAAIVASTVAELRRQDDRGRRVQSARAVLAAEAKRSREAKVAAARAALTMEVQ